MKGLGIILIVCGVLLMGSAVVSLFDKSEKPVTKQLAIRADNGETMAILPLLGVVSLALGGALLTSHYITKKR